MQSIARYNYCKKKLVQHLCEIIQKVEKSPTFRMYLHFIHYFQTATITEKVLKITYVFQHGVGRKTERTVPVADVWFRFYTILRLPELGIFHLFIFTYNTVIINPSIPNYCGFIFHLKPMLDVMQNDPDGHLL